MAEQIPREQFSAWANIPARVLLLPCIAGLRRRRGRQGALVILRLTNCGLLVLPL